MPGEFTTIALLPSDKEALDEINDVEFDGDASYREVLESLCELYEQSTRNGHEAFVVDHRQESPFRVTD